MPSPPKYTRDLFGLLSFRTCRAERVLQDANSSASASFRTRTAAPPRSSGREQQRQRVLQDANSSANRVLQDTGGGVSGASVTSCRNASKTAGDHHTRLSFSRSTAS